MARIKKPEDENIPLIGNLEDEENERKKSRYGIEEKDEEIEKEKIEKELKKDKKDETILTSLDDYIKTAAYLGTKVITPTMRKYVYRRRLDGLAILNTNIVDKKLKEAIDFIVQFKPDEWTLVCKREAGWRAAKIFSELTGVRLFTKKYPAGIITNIVLPNFFETKMVMVCDPWLDKNALNDAKIVQIPVVGVCDTNNNTNNIDVVVISNNKSNKSLGLIFWLLSREYMKAHKIDKPLPSLEDFAGETLVLEEPKKKKKAKDKEEALKSEEEKIEEKMKQISQAEEGV
jgi:small subunit ribosomal protein S2